MLTFVAAHKDEVKARETDIAVADAQVAPDTNAQLNSDAGVSLSTKKKKPNNRKNKKKTKKKKKKKKAAETTETAESTVTTSTTALDDSVDPNDPFSGQLAEIAALERGSQGPAPHRGHAEGAQTVCLALR